MKTTLKIITFTILLIQLSCAKNDTSLDTLTNQITGEWQLTTRLIDSGNGPIWVDIDDGYTYTFDRNGSFTSTRFTDCDYGTYSVNGDELNLIFGCPDFTVWFESPNDAFVDRIEFENNTTVILYPINPFCIEQCATRFTKISE
jgi:hypothetical protein